MATALDQFLEPLEQAISAATTVGKRLVSAACPPAGVSLFEDPEKRKELAGALLMDKAGAVFGAGPCPTPPCISDLGSSVGGSSISPVGSLRDLATDLR